MNRQALDLFCPFSAERASAVVPWGGNFSGLRALPGGLALQAVSLPQPWTRVRASSPIGAGRPGAKGEMI